MGENALAENRNDAGDKTGSGNSQVIRIYVTPFAEESRQSVVLYKKYNRKISECKAVDEIKNCGYNFGVNDF